MTPSERLAAMDELRRAAEEVIALREELDELWYYGDDDEDADELEELTFALSATQEAMRALWRSFPERANEPCPSARQVLKYLDLSKSMAKE